MRFLKAVLPLLLLMVTSSGNAQDPAVRRADTFVQSLDSLREAYHLPGLSYAVIKDDSIILKGGLGHADLEEKTSTTATTNYRIASLTKPIASTVLLQLQQEGRFSIYDSIKPLIPGYEDFYRQVSKYILANEPQYASLVENFDFERNDLTIWHHLTHTAEYTPGDAYRYNGFLFGTLSRLMEFTLKQPFGEILQDRIFDPLAMTLSSPSQELAPAETLAQLAKPYRYVAEQAEYRRSEYPSPDVNAGAGIVSNVLDLAIFDRAIDHHTLLDTASQVAAWTNQRTNAGEPIPYGLGWFVQQHGSNKVVWHYGWQPEAFSGLYLKFPEDGLTLILLANGENLSAPFKELGYEQDVFVSPFAQLFVDTFVNR